MNELEEMNIVFEKKVDPNSSMPRVEAVEVSKIKDHINKIINSYIESQESSYSSMTEKVNVMIARQFSGANVEVLNFSWNFAKSRNLDRPENGHVKSKDGCEQQRFILSTESLPQDKCCYFEILKGHQSGCYDSIGVCIKREDNTRNGVTDQGWAVRMYGSHSDLTFTGKIHNNDKKEFYDQWAAETRVGVFYNPAKGTLSYFENGKFLETAFENVKSEQELFICLEICHKGYYEIVSNVELPERD